MIGYVWIQMLMKHQPNGKADIWEKCCPTIEKFINQILWDNSRQKFELDDRLQDVSKKLSIAAGLTHIVQTATLFLQNF